MHVYIAPITVDRLQYPCRVIRCTSTYTMGYLNYHHFEVLEFRDEQDLTFASRYGTARGYRYHMRADTYEQALTAMVHHCEKLHDDRVTEQGNWLGNVKDRTRNFVKV